MRLKSSNLDIGKVLPFLSNFSGALVRKCKRNHRATEFLAVGDVPRKVRIILC